MARKAKPKAEQIDLKRLRARDGDVFIIREPKDAQEGYREAVIKKLSNALKGKHVVILFAPSLSDVKLLSPEQLAKVGLQRIPDES